MKKIVCLLILMLAATIASAQQQQQQPNEGDKIVSVPQKYVSAEGLTHQIPPADNQWMNLGREVGIATREGLNAVVDTSERFGKTRVGTFIMVVVAWRVMSEQIIGLSQRLLGIIIGVPLMIGGIFIWLSLVRKFFFGSRMLVKTEGSLFARVRTYEKRPAYDFDSSDSKVAAGCVFTIAIVLWCIVMLAIIF